MASPVEASRQAVTPLQLTKSRPSRWAGTLRQAGISPAEYSRNEQVDAWAAARLAEEAIP